MKTLGAELSINLFPTATWSGYDAAQAEAAVYPGLRPSGSWTLASDGELHGVDAAGDDWYDRETGEHIDLSGRHLVLAYGSNPDPAKLMKRLDFGGDSLIGLRAAVFGWAAVWCDARRGDGSVVCTLARVPGRMEVHPVLALTPYQLEAMDRWEGHPNVYRRNTFDGLVELESGERPGDVEVYLGTPKRRRPLVVDGGYLLCAEVPYREADRLVKR